MLKHFCSLERYKVNQKRTAKLQSLKDEESCLNIEHLVKAFS